MLRVSACICRVPCVSVGTAERGELVFELVLEYKRRERAPLTTPGANWKHNKEAALAARQSKKCVYPTVDYTSRSGGDCRGPSERP